MRIKQNCIVITEADLLAALSDSTASKKQKSRIKRLYGMATTPTDADVMRLAGHKVTVAWWRDFLLAADVIDAPADEQLRAIAAHAEKIVQKQAAKTRKRGKKSRQDRRKARAEAAAFYDSDRWRSLRWRVLEKYGFSCMACGRNHREHKVVIHVDHIKPKSTHPDLALVFENLQVLCSDCNIGKSNRSEADLRPD